MTIVKHLNEKYRFFNKKNQKIAISSNKKKLYICMFYHKDLTVSRLERNQIIVLHWLTFLYSKKEKQQYKTERALLKDTRPVIQVPGVANESKYRSAWSWCWCASKFWPDANNWQDDSAACRLAYTLEAQVWRFERVSAFAASCSILTASCLSPREIQSLELDPSYRILLGKKNERCI